MYSVHLIQNVAEQIAVQHSVVKTFKDRCNNISPIASVCALKRAEICKKAGAAFAVRAFCLIVIDKGNQIVAGDAILFCSPVAPAVLRLYNRLVSPSFKFYLFFSY